VALHSRRLGIAIPDTVLEDDRTLPEKTLKIGNIARSCSIFGVDSITIFPVHSGKSEAQLIKKILQYLETPQYLRKRLFPLDPELRYAGMLPPLRIPSHKLKVSLAAVKVGEIREGVTISKDGQSIDIGLDRPLQLSRTSSLGRVTVTITGTNPLRGRLARRTEVGQYWGYIVEIKEIDKLLSDSTYDLKIATSRYGDPLGNVVEQLGRSLRASRSVLLIFGSPSQGLLKIIGEEVKRRVDFLVNLFYDQQVVTVRTEEALMAALYLMNVLSVQQ
jgi:predicted SPOUT superfamily RNA methylase MTH1